MLYKIALFFLLSFELWGLSSELEKCMTTALLTRTDHTKRSLKVSKISHGEYAVKKEFRTLINKAKPAQYDKHIKAKNIDQAIKMSAKKGDSAAQYLPGLNRVKVERSALMDRPGVYKSFDDGVKKGTFYKFVKFDDVVGFDGGKGTKWLRVEWSSGYFHGHPMSAKRIQKQCPECSL